MSYPTDLNRVRAQQLQVRTREMEREIMSGSISAGRIRAEDARDREREKERELEAMSRQYNPEDERSAQDEMMWQQVLAREEWFEMFWQRWHEWESSYLAASFPIPPHSTSSVHRLSPPAAP